MRGFFIRAAIVALGLWVASQLIHGIEIRDAASLIWAAVLLAIVNAIVRPVLILLTLPITLLTLGLFLLVINGLMVELVSSLLTGFYVAGLGSAILVRADRHADELGGEQLHRPAGAGRGDHGATVLTA